MNYEILNAEIHDEKLYFDPRTKLLLILTVSLFVLGGMGTGHLIQGFKYILIFFPLLLLLLTKEFKKAFVFLGMMIACILANAYLVIYLYGTVQFIVSACINIYLRFVPQLMLAYFFMTTTTVSEFTGAMKRMHISDKIVIPLSVMFRFIPTVIEEASAINSAMKMRKLKSNGILNYMEYNLIPLITCVVNIGQELSAAALSRGLGGKRKRTNVCDIGFRFLDVIIIIFCASMYVICILEKFIVI